jgi:hypothetical protein
MPHLQEAAPLTGSAALGVKGRLRAAASLTSLCAQAPWCVARQKPKLAGGAFRHLSCGIGNALVEVFRS